MGIPKRNGLRDDVQVLWSGSALNNFAYNSPNDIGPGTEQYIWALYNTATHAADLRARDGRVRGRRSTGATRRPARPARLPRRCTRRAFFGGRFVRHERDVAAARRTPRYADDVSYNTPFGTPIATSYDQRQGAGDLLRAGHAGARLPRAVPLNDNSANVNRNDTGITKVQYTYALSQSAYLRAYGYTFYSDWLATYADLARRHVTCSCPRRYSPEYDLITHTSGAALDFQDQINDQNLVSLDGNYTTAGVIRFNNTSGYLGCRGACVGGSPIGYMSKTGKGFTCFDPATGQKQAAELCLEQFLLRRGHRRRRSLRPGRPRRRAVRLASARRDRRRRGPAPPGTACGTATPTGR